jgi:cytochrome c oxidase subunit 1
VIPVHARKPIFGYKAIAYSSLTICLVGLFVWGSPHVHQRHPSLDADVSSPSPPLIVAVPTGVKNLLAGWATLWGGKIRFTSAMLFCPLVLLAMFCAGGALSGVTLGTAPVDIHVHDTYYVVAPLPLRTVSAARSLASTRAFTIGFPKITGRYMNEGLGKTALLSLTFIGTNLTFLPMHQLGPPGDASPGGHVRPPNSRALTSSVPSEPFLLGASVFALLH